MVAVELEEPDYGAALQGLSFGISSLQLDFARYAVLFAASGQWAREGFNTPADWIRFNCHMTAHAAWNALAVGEQEEKLPATMAAMKKGEIGFAHLATMANTADKVKGFEESALLPLAKEHSPGKFHYKAMHYRHALDAKGYNREQEALREQRYLALSTAQDGCLLLHGAFDPLSGAAIRSALEPLAQPSGEHDDRTREQRLADALEERVTGWGPANLQVTATVETLQAMAGAPGGEAEFSLPLSQESVQRIACDCRVSRVLLSQESLVIDVGRAKRLVEGGLRKALSVRDKHCRWPGCERPASWCQAHHLVQWAAGGETDLENCVLLCKRHHRMVHEGGWQLVRRNGKVVPVAPAVNFGYARAPDG